MSETPINEQFVGQLLESRYRLLQFLSAGNFGAVFRGQLEIFGESVRDIAVKITKETELDREKAKHVFAEAVILAGIYDEITDPVAKQYIVPIHDFGILKDHDDRGFIVMGLIRGKGTTSDKHVPATTLKREIEKYSKGMPSEVSLAFFRQICQGMAAVHALGVIHRDLKPDNILMTDRGQIRIVDFGLAAGLDSIRVARGSVGTHAYMAPETATRATSGPASDVYSLGIILYELLTCKFPFASLVPPVGMPTSEQHEWIVEQKRKVVLDLPSQSNTDVTEWLDAATMICLAYKDDERFVDAGDLLKALEQKEEHPLIREWIHRRRGIEDDDEKRGLVGLLAKVKKIVLGENLSARAKDIERAIAAREGNKDDLWFKDKVALAFLYLKMTESGEKKSSDVLKVLDEIEPYVERGRFFASYGERADFYDEVATAMEQHGKTKLSARKYRNRAKEERAKSSRSEL